MRSSPSGPSLTRVSIAGLLLTAALGVFACGSDAVGVDTCRRIERFRCKAAPICFTDWNQDDVDLCEAHYEDACLHGIANDSRAIGKSEVDACIEAINATVACKEENVATMDECSHVALVEGTTASTVETCSPIVARPEVLKACSFLVKPAEAETSSTGGGGGSGGGT